MSSIYCKIIADLFADLGKLERIEKAVEVYLKDNGLTVRKVSKIYKYAYTIISRQFKEILKSKKIIRPQLQFLNSIEERIIVK